MKDLPRIDNTLEKSDRGKRIALEMTSSSGQYMSPMGTTPTWLRLEVLTHQRRYVDYIEAEGLETLMKVARTLAPIQGNPN